MAKGRRSELTRFVRISGSRRRSPAASKHIQHSMRRNCNARQYASAAHTLHRASRFRSHSSDPSPRSTDRKFRRDRTPSSKVDIIRSLPVEC